MTEIGPNNFNEILLNVRRFRLTKEQVFRLWKCAVKDNDKLVDAAIEKLYEEMIAFDPARAESVVQLTINRDDTAEEFDSTSLKVEKVIAGRGEAVVRLRSLDPGTYPFIGEYHSDTAKGNVIAE